MVFKITIDFKNSLCIKIVFCIQKQTPQSESLFSTLLLLFSDFKRTFKHFVNILFYKKFTFHHVALQTATKCLEIPGRIRHGFDILQNIKIIGICQKFRLQNCFLVLYSSSF